MDYKSHQTKANAKRYEDIRQSYQTDILFSSCPRKYLYYDLARIAVKENDITC